MVRYESTTKPQFPSDETPLTGEDVAHMLGAMPPQMILVGGQALAFWMEHYGIKASNGAEITSDGDVLGTLQEARLLARRLNGKLRVPPARALTALVAQVRLPLSSNGLERNIDVLHKLYDLGGLRKSTEFTRRAVARERVIQMESGVRFRVLHPLDLLASRVNNAAGLLDVKGSHVLTQTRWAIKVMREAFLSAATSSEPARLGAMVQEIQRLPKAAAGCVLFKQHNIEVFNAIPVKALIRLRPELKEQCKRMALAMTAQRNIGLAASVNRSNARVQQVKNSD